VKVVDNAGGVGNNSPAENRYENDYHNNGNEGWNQAYPCADFPGIQVAKGALRIFAGVGNVELGRRPRYNQRNNCANKAGYAIAKAGYDRKNA
jgi:hypothetical protein